MGISSFSRVLAAYEDKRGSRGCGLCIRAVCRRRLPEYRLVTMGHMGLMGRPSE
jgi:hypothetical protein